MKLVRFSGLLSAGLLIFVAAYQSARLSFSETMVQPGEAVSGMNFTTGAKDAPPLSAFCNPIRQTGNVTVTSCDLPVLRRLGVGDLFALAGGKLYGVDWSALNWELSFDDRPLDLNAFGTSDYVAPISPAKPSSLTEVFKKFKAWDVVLTNLSPGEHILHGVARTQRDSYTWVIQITIKADTLPVGMQERP